MLEARRFRLRHFVHRFTDPPRYFKRPEPSGDFGPKVITQSAVRSSVRRSRDHTGTLAPQTLALPSLDARSLPVGRHVGPRILALRPAPKYSENFGNK